MTAQDVAGVIAEKIRRRASFIQRWNNTSSPERHKTLEDEAVEAAAELIEVASLLESQAQALSEAEASNTALWTINGQSSGQIKTLVGQKTEWMDRALAAESRLAEAMRVIEPFALIAEHDVSSIETDADTYQPMTYNTVPNISIGMLRAARDFLNAAKDKT